MHMYRCELNGIDVSLRQGSAVFATLRLNEHTSMSENNVLLESSAYIQLPESLKVRVCTII
jgi:hypothetical protein